MLGVTMEPRQPADGGTSGRDHGGISEESRAMLDMMLERGPVADHLADRHRFRVLLRQAENAARTALEVAEAQGYRSDCVSAALSALQRALTNVYHEDACAVMGREP